jgi:serine/threonine-protein kinase
MGMVFKAHDRVLDEIVALKTLRWDVAREPDVARRFQAETKLARKVRHRNVCGIHEYGDANGLRYIAMELVDGIDLRRLLKEGAEGGPLPTEEAFDMTLQIARGLEAIHKAGVIHRDLKTPNIMRDSKGVIRLMDFGIAKQSGSETTLGGQVVGTPEYMSPEQARGHKVSFRSDIYALGVVVFEIFTGRVPFSAETPIATILKQLHDPPPLDGPIAAPIPRPVIPVLRRALQKLPGDRYASAHEMLEALEEARETWRKPAAPASAEASPLAGTRGAGDGHEEAAGGGAAGAPAQPLAAPARGQAGPPAWAVALPAAAAAAFVVWVLMRGGTTPTEGPSPSPSIGASHSAAPSDPPGETLDATRPPRSSPPSTPPVRAVASPTPVASPPSPAVAGRERRPELAPPTTVAEMTIPSPPLPSPGSISPPAATLPSPSNTPRPRPPGVRRGDLVRDGPGVKLPRILTSIPPAYPPAAERLRRDATVVVEALVDENGKVLEVRVSRPDPSRFGFNEAAKAAALATTFEPATKDGVPVRIWFPMKLSFTPREPEGR